MQIELQQVTKRLGGIAVLDGVDLRLESGQVIAVLGANGAGKTTLMHLLSGLYLPSNGKVLFDGEPLERKRLDLRRRFHYLPDVPPILNTMTPLAYIAATTELYGRSDEEADRCIADLLEQFNMLTVCDLPAARLSRGQRYKAALIAMLAIDAEFWILDEPFASGMDPQGLSALRQHIDSARARGRIILFSTQMVELARQIADKVCVLGSSKVVAYESPSALKPSPENSTMLNDLLQQLSETKDV